MTYLFMVFQNLADSDSTLPSFPKALRYFTEVIFKENRDFLLLKFPYTKEITLYFKGNLHED